MIIKGHLQDLDASHLRPRLELYFASRDRPVLPKGERAGVVLDSGRDCWRGTMNSANGNRPYVHTMLTHDGGLSSTCTAVFLRLGWAERAELEFDLTDSRVFRLARVVATGRWKDGNAPLERAARAKLISHTRALAHPYQPHHN
jgi:hypothetical protein